LLHSVHNVAVRLPLAVCGRARPRPRAHRPPRARRPAAGAVARSRAPPPPGRWARAAGLAGGPAPEGGLPSPSAARARVGRRRHGELPGAGEVAGDVGAEVVLDLLHRAPCVDPDEAELVREAIVL